MKREKYETTVAEVALRTMAEEEGRLRAGVELKLASNARMSEDLKQFTEGSDDRRKLLVAIEQCARIAETMAREAGAIHERAEKLFAAEGPPQKRYTLEDVVFTLRPILTPEEGWRLNMEELEFLATREIGPTERARLRYISGALSTHPWPTPVDTTVGACVRVLDALIAGRPTPTLK